MNVFVFLNIKELNKGKVTIRDLILGTLQWNLEPPFQLPFHLVETASYPWSLKLFDSDKTPILIPITIKRGTQITQIITKVVECLRVYKRKIRLTCVKVANMVDSPNLERFQSEFERNSTIILNSTKVPWSSYL